MLNEMRNILKDYCKKHNIEIVEKQEYINKFYNGINAITNTGSIEVFKSGNNINHRNSATYVLVVNGKKINKSEW